MRLFISIPLFVYLLIAANVVMIAGGPHNPMTNIILAEFSLPSGARTILTVSDLLIIAGVLFLYIETFKATRTSVLSIVDHSLSLLVFVAFLIEYLVVEAVGNATFLILSITSLMDVIVGFTVTISTAKRDLTFGG